MQSLVLVADEGQFTQVGAIEQLDDVALRHFHRLVEQRHQHNRRVLLVSLVPENRTVHLVAALFQQVADGVRDALAVFRVEAIQQFGDVILGEVRKFFPGIPPHPPSREVWLLLKTLFLIPLCVGARAWTRGCMRARLYISPRFSPRDAGVHNGDSAFSTRDAGVHNGDSPFSARDAGVHNGDSAFSARDAGVHNGTSVCGTFFSAIIPAFFSEDCSSPGQSVGRAR